MPPPGLPFEPGGLKRSSPDEAEDDVPQPPPGRRAEETPVPEAAFDELLLCECVGEGPTEIDEVLWVNEAEVLLANGRGEINVKDDRWKTPDGRRLVEAGFRREMSALVRETGAWSLLPLEESQLIRSIKSERIMKPRPVWTERVGSDGSAELKCRLMLQGFRDPDIVGCRKTA